MPLKITLTALNRAPGKIRHQIGDGNSVDLTFRGRIVARVVPLTAERTVLSPPTEGQTAAWSDAWKGWARFARDGSGRFCARPK